jgi:uncharacterized protein (TIGR02246 family)
MTTNPGMADVRDNDEQAIRKLVDRWLAASKAGDHETLLSLLDEDVVFLTPSREPFGKEEFAQPNESMKDTAMDSSIDIKEIKVSGEWAWMRSFLRVALTPARGEPLKLSGHILTILRKNPNGQWVIARDANFVTPEIDSDKKAN